MEDKVVELVGGGSDINGATPSNLSADWFYLFLEAETSIQDKKVNIPKVKKKLFIKQIFHPIIGTNSVKIKETGVTYFTPQK